MYCILIASIEYLGGGGALFLRRSNQTFHNDTLAPKQLKTTIIII